MGTSQPDSDSIVREIEQEIEKRVERRRMETAITKRENRMFGSESVSPVLDLFRIRRELASLHVLRTRVG